MKKANMELGQNSRHQRRQGGRRGYMVKKADMEKDKTADNKEGKRKERLYGEES